MTGTPWREDGNGIINAGAVGGDIQIGDAPSRRFLHAALPGRVVDVTAYPIAGDGTTPDPGPDAPIRLEIQTSVTVCRDIDDPGGTEIWADIEYSNLPEAYDRDYDTIEQAEAAARRYVETFDPAHIGWDGAPSITR